MKSNSGMTGIEILVVLAVATLFTVCVVSMNGCTGLQTQSPAQKEQLAQVGIQLVSFNVGYYVGDKQPQADPLIRASYVSARTGKLSPDLVAAAVDELRIKDPLLAGNALICLRAMGAVTTPEGQVINIAAITPAVWDAAADGYMQGFELGKLKK